MLFYVCLDGVLMRFFMMNVFLFTSSKLKQELLLLNRIRSDGFDSNYVYVYVVARGGVQYEICFPSSDNFVSLYNIYKNIRTMYESKTATETY